MPSPKELDFPFRRNSLHFEIEIDGIVSPVLHVRQANQVSLKNLHMRRIPSTSNSGFMQGIAGSADNSARLLVLKPNQPRHFQNNQPSAYYSLNDIYTGATTSSSFGCLPSTFPLFSLLHFWIILLKLRQVANI